MVHQLSHLVLMQLAGRGTCLYCTYFPTVHGLSHLELMQLEGHLLILHLPSDGARVVALGVDASLLGGALGVAGAAHTYTQERQMIKCGLSGVF